MLINVGFLLMLFFFRGWFTLFFMGKSTISMAIFNSYVKLPSGNLINRKINHCITMILVNVNHY